MIAGCGPWGRARGIPSCQGTHASIWDAISDQWCRVRQESRIGSACSCGLSFLSGLLSDCCSLLQVGL